MKLNNFVKIIDRENKVLVYFSDKGDIFETNQIGKFIIGKIQNNFSKKEIIEALVKETNENPKKIEVDVDKFIKLLKNKGIVK